MYFNLSTENKINNNNNNNNNNNSHKFTLVNFSFVLRVKRWLVFDFQGVNKA